jgi:hypothetical protein
MLQRRGNHSPSMVSNQIEALTGLVLAKQVSGRQTSKRLQRLQRKAHGVWRESSATALGACRQERR